MQNMSNSIGPTYLARLFRAKPCFLGPQKLASAKQPKSFCWLNSDQAKTI